jgi:RNA methyltransferase, TrmH family
MAKTSESALTAQHRLRRIEGRHNALLKQLRQAFWHAELTEDGDCAIEGMRILEEAIRSGLRFRAVFFRESAQERAERLLPQLGAHVETLLLPDKLFDGAVPSDTPQGVAALVRLKEFSTDHLIERISVGPIMVLVGVQDPGNVGTVLRSSEAFGSAGVLLGEGTVSPFNSKVIRASAGSVFRIPMLTVKLAAGFETILETLRSHRVRLLATSSHKGTKLSETNLAGSVAIFVGSEGSGLPRALLAKMDDTIVIPHTPQVESLNAGVAGSIILYESARQRK